MFDGKKNYFGIKHNLYDYFVNMYIKEGEHFHT
jgi:hypothetical protein